LPFYEQAALYEAFNAARCSPYGSSTPYQQHLAPLLCPSDTGTDTLWNNQDGKHSYHPVYGDVLFGCRLEPSNYASGSKYAWDSEGHWGPPDAVGSERVIYESDSNLRSMFAAIQMKKPISACTDGTSNTIMFSERVNVSESFEHGDNNPKKGAVGDADYPQYTEGTKPLTRQTVRDILDGRLLQKFRWQADLGKLSRSTMGKWSHCLLRTLYGSPA
jgi:hypothetical protein